MTSPDHSPNAEHTLILVPAYNAAQYLPELVKRLKQFTPVEHVLLVDDGSKDNTDHILRELGVPYISYADNRGKGSALKTGFAYAIENGYRSVLTIDADLQHLPEHLPEFLKLDNGRRLIIGTRDINRKIMPFDRWLTNNLTSLIISVFSRQRVRDSQSGYRLIPTRVLAAIPLDTIGYDLESEMLFKAGAVGCEVAEVPIATVYHGSKSFINPLKDTGKFIRQIWRRVWC